MYMCICVYIDYTHTVRIRERKKVVQFDNNKAQVTHTHREG